MGEIPYETSSESFPRTQETGVFMCDAQPENPPVGPQPEYYWKDWTKEDPPMGPVVVTFSEDGTQKFIEVSNYPCRTHGQEPGTINTQYYPAGKIDDHYEAFRSDNQQWWMIYDTNCGGNNDHPEAWYLTPKSPDFSRTDNLEGRQDGGCTNTMRIEIPYETSFESFPTTHETGVFMCDAQPENPQVGPQPEYYWKDWTKEN